MWANSTLLLARSLAPLLKVRDFGMTLLRFLSELSGDLVLGTEEECPHGADD